MAAIDITFPLNIAAGGTLNIPSTAIPPEAVQALIEVPWTDYMAAPALDVNFAMFITDDGGTTWRELASAHMYGAAKGKDGLLKAMQTFVIPLPKYNNNPRRVQGSVGSNLAFASSARIRTLP
jgi:hypothetical protein